MQRGDPDHPVSTANLKCMAEKMGKGEWEVGNKGGKRKLGGRLE